MKNTLQERCDLFIRNRDAIKSAFKWESSYFYPLCAGLYASENREADIDTMLACKDLLKKRVNLFSNFRGLTGMATITLLSLSQNPQSTLDDMLIAYKNLKNHFMSSTHLTTAAETMFVLAEPDDYEAIAVSASSVYKSMKKQHPILTSSEDCAFAVLLALSGMECERIAQEVQSCYEILKPNFFSKDKLQSLCHVLALGASSAQNKCQNLLYLYDLLKERGYKYGTSYELPTLGAIAILNLRMDSIAIDIMDVDDYLKTQKGFGAFGIGSRQRLMHAALITMYDYMPNNMSMQSATINGTIPLLIAQQAAICASIAATSAVTAAANTSSSS